MRPTKPRELAALLTETDAHRYEYFVKRVADSQEVLGLWLRDWLLLTADDGRRVLPLWPAVEFAEAASRPNWADHTTKSMDLESFLRIQVPDAIAKGTWFSVFPVAPSEGVLREPEVLARDLEQELAKYG